MQLPVYQSAAIKLFSGKLSGRKNVIEIGNHETDLPCKRL